MEVLNTFRRATRNAVRARERENGDLNKQAAAATKPSNSFRTALSGIVNSSSTQQKSTSAVKKCKKSTKTKKRGHRVSFDGVEHCEFDSESPAKRRLIGAGVDCVGTVDDLDDEQLAIELHASGLDADGLDRDEMITELNSIQRQNLAEKLSRWGMLEGSRLEQLSTHQLMLKRRLMARLQRKVVLVLAELDCVKLAPRKLVKELQKYRLNTQGSREAQEERLDWAMLKESKRTKIDGDGYHYGRVMISAEEILEDLSDVKLKAKLVNDFEIATKQIPRQKQEKRSMLLRLMDERVQEQELDALEIVLRSELAHYRAENGKSPNGKSSPGCRSTTKMFEELESLVAAVELDGTCLWAFEQDEDLEISFSGACNVTY